MSGGIGGGSQRVPQVQGMPVVVSVGLQQGSRTRAWSYDTISVISLLQLGFSSNFPSSGSSVAIVKGLSLSSIGRSASIRVGMYSLENRYSTGATACGGSIWLSDSSLLCKIGSGSGDSSLFQGLLYNIHGVPIVATVGFQQGSQTRALSYDAASAIIVSGKANGPSSGSTSMTVIGLNFGSVGYSGGAQEQYSVLKGGTAFEGSSWVSNSALVCKLNSGRARERSDVPLVVTVGSQQAVRTQVWSFSCPVINRISALNVDSSGPTASVFNAPASGCTAIYVSGFAYGSSSPSSSASFAGTSLPVTLWTSDSHLLSRLSPGFVSKLPNFIVSAALTAASMSAVLSYDPPLATGVGSSSDSSLGNISITGSNYGVSVALVDRNVGCLGSITMGPGQVLDVCISDKLSDALGASVTQAIFGISFADVKRFDDVSVSIVSPRQKEFYLLRGNCFGAIECGSLRGLGFVFQILPLSFKGTPPDSLCKSQGEYSAPNASEPFQELRSASTALGRWSVRVYSGSQPLNITDVSILFKTSSLNVYIGESPASSFAWTSDSSITAAVPGFQSQHKQSASGWGRNHSIGSNGQFCRSCLFSYPDPEITNVSSSWPSTGSAGIQVSGFHLSNVNPSLRSRIFASASGRTMWLSDTSATCFAPSKVSTSFRFVAVSIGNGVFASFAHGAGFRVEGPSIVRSNFSSAYFATTGSSCASIVGLNFGKWDSTLRSRLYAQVHSAASVTRWLQDSVASVATKIAAALADYQTLSLTFSSLLYEFSLPSVKVPRKFVVAPDSFLSTGSQIVSVTGLQFGVDSQSLSMNILHSAAPHSLWISDSSAVCKSAAGSAASVAGSAIILSVDRSVSVSQGSWQLQQTAFTVQKPSASGVNISNSTLNADNEPVSLLVFAISGLGSFDPQYNMIVEKAACRASWTSDSSMSCLYSKPISKDRVQLQIDIRTGGNYDSSFTYSAPPISSNMIPNPALVPSSRPIAASFRAAMFLPMPQSIRNRVDSYAGPVDAAPDFVAETGRTVYQYAEIIDIDVLFYCNHTQVYLKAFLPYAIDVRGNFSIVSAQNETKLSDLICDGSLALHHALQPNSFTTVSRSSIVMCPKVDIFSAFLRFNFVVINETGSPIDFTIDSQLFDLISSSKYIALSSNTSIGLFSEYIAGKDAFSHAFVLNTSASCDRIAFQYIATLKCNLPNGTLSSASPFYINATRAMTASSATGWSRRTCVVNISGWVFFVATTCVVSLSIPMFPSTALQSPAFSVVGGDPVSLTLSGSIYTQLQEGDAVWSANSTRLKCLSVFLFDEFGNVVPKCQTSFELSAVALNHTRETAYSLYGPTRGVSDCKGSLSWCDVRTPSAGIVRLSVLSPWFNTTLPGTLNISGQGQPARFVMMSNVTFNQSSLAGGASLPPITIQLTNAVGTPLLSIAKTVVIRIRVVPKASTNRCIHSNPHSMFHRANTRAPCLKCSH